MTEKTLDPTEFAERLDGAFDAEPRHASFDDDLAVARRRLRKHRVTTALGGAGVAAVAATALLVVPGVLPHPASDLQVASAPLSDADVVRDCVSHNDHVTAGSPDRQGKMTDDDILTRGQVEQRMGDARLMTRADAGPETLATVRSEDGKWWVECTLSRREPALKAITVLYPTDVKTEPATVEGVRAYKARSLNDPYLAGTATSNIPGLEPNCEASAPEESAAWYRELSQCESVRIHWNDRRPADVAKVVVTAPDGTEVSADVNEGYVSLDWIGPMTPDVSKAWTQGDGRYWLRDVAFYDEHGKLLTDRTLHEPEDLERLTIDNYPSLAYWTND